MAGNLQEIDILASDLALEQSEHNFATFLESVGHEKLIIQTQLTQPSHIVLTQFEQVNLVL